MDSFGTIIRGDYATGKTDLRELAGRTFVPNECVLLLCTRGCAVVSVNTRKEIVKKGDLVVLFSDVILSPLQISSLFRADFLIFSRKLMEKIYYDLTSDNFWKSIYDNHILHLSDEQYDLMCGWFRQMKWIMDNGDDNNKIAILRSTLYNLFMLLDGEMRRNFPALLKSNEKDRARMLFGKFMALVIKNCHHCREVSWYAERLCITKGYLYKVCCKVEHRTPKEIIDNIVINEIKQYLSDTELSVTEIARKFNFDDSSYLARFFRRMTGLSPLDYRGR